MSATTERQESGGQSAGFVGETLRRPIQEAVKEGVKEALREEADVRHTDEGESSGDEGDDSGGGGRFALLAVLGIGVAAFLLWRRRSGGSGGGGGMTESIRQESKTIETGSEPSESVTAGGSDLSGESEEDSEEGAEAEATSD